MISTKINEAIILADKVVTPSPYVHEIANIIRAGFRIPNAINSPFLPGVAAAVAFNALSKPFSNYNGKVPQQTAVQRELYKNFTGKSIVVNLEIQGATYQKGGFFYSFPDLVFEAILVTVQQTKNVVTTPMQGFDGTVKEYISDGDWNVNIKGVVLGPNGVYPLEDVTNLKLALDANIPLIVNSWYLQLFGIDQIVVTDKIFPQEEGGISQQLFEFNALSDKPIELLIS